jgi:RND family efflux transporter MFP subunit
VTTRAEHPGAAPGPRPEASSRASRVVVTLGVFLVILAALAVLALYAHRRYAERAQREALVASRARGLRVAVVQVQTTPGQRTFTLPGDVSAYNQATLYAKVSGYVRNVFVQRGQRVKRGDVLATIDSPETEKDVLTARHDAAIARINADRAERLAPSGVVAQQERDNAVAQHRVADSSLARARDVLDYTIIRAPFDGVVSARYVDPGALLPASGATAGALPVVDISDTDRLRIFVYVGQDAAPFVRAGDEVTVWQDELPDRRIPAKVTFTAGALDPRTRTMQIEVDLDNRKWELLPGTFAHVDVRVAGPSQPLVPDEAVVVRDGKTMVVAIADDRARYVPVDLGYNDGVNVRVLRGLQGGETIGLDVPVEVQDGDAVQPAETGQDGGSKGIH